jgi:hypothetical protein
VAIVAKARCSVKPLRPATQCPCRQPLDVSRTTCAGPPCGTWCAPVVPQTVAMKLIGHKTDSVFRRYDIVSPNDLRVAVELLDAPALTRPQSVKTS